MLNVFLIKFQLNNQKYISLHVGIFWSIGKFIIKNGDTVLLILDLRSIYEHLSNKTKSQDPFKKTRTNFIIQLINQWELSVGYQLSEPDENRAKILLSS